MGLAIDWFNAAASTLFDALVLLGLGRPWLEAAAAGIAVGSVSALIFARTAPRVLLSTSWSRLSTELMEIWLYRRLPGVVLRAEGRLVAASVRLLGGLLAPLLVSSLVAAPLLIQSCSRFGHDPIPVGGSVLVTAEVDADRLIAGRASTSLVWLEGEGQILGPVRDLDEGLFTWRVRPAVGGINRLELQIDGWRHDLPLGVGPGQGRPRAGLHNVPARGRQRQPLSRLLRPRGLPLEPDSPVLQMAVAYPAAPRRWMAWLALGSVLGAGLASAGLASRTKRGGRSL